MEYSHSGWKNKDGTSDRNALRGAGSNTGKDGAHMYCPKIDR